MTNQSSLSNMINALVDRAFQRIIRYECDYSKQLKELEMHWGTAKKVNDLTLGGRVVTVMGVLHATFGYLDKAQQCFFEARDIYATLDKTDRLISVYINLTRSSTNMGEYERALKFCREGLTTPNLEDHPSEYAGLLGNQLAALVATEQFEEAERCVEQINAISGRFAESNPQYYARIMAHVYRDAAELALHFQNFEEAHSKVKLGLELAESLNLRVERADLYFTRAHIALIETPDSLDAIEDCFEKAEEIIKGLESPVMAGNSLLAEARLLQRIKRLNKAQFFAKEAAAIFEKHQMKNALQQTQKILDMQHPENFG
jgi:tetratricopeptide (TPR) repeat protein